MKLAGLGTSYGVWISWIREELRMIVKPSA